MKIYITAPGDPSVGIGPSEAEVNLPDWVAETLDKREVAEILKSAFCELFDDSVSVEFATDQEDATSSGYEPAYDEDEHELIVRAIKELLYEEE